MQAERRSASWDIRVTETMRWHWLAIGLAAIMLVILMLAWFDGGREQVRPIVEPIAVPPAPLSGLGE